MAIVKAFLIRYLSLMKSAKKYIIGNWKMHGDPVMALPLVETIIEQAAKKPDNVEVVLCPPATLIGEVARLLIGTDLHIGGQDCHYEAQGAFTGDISASMLKNAGCSYVIVGHSERRHGHAESSETVRKKAEAALQAGLTPIICIGETLAQREAGQAEVVVGEQLRLSLPPITHNPKPITHFLLAYEPVWAIGTGRTATADDILAMHTYIHAQTGGARVVLYGGSVKAANAREILTTEGVSGVLVGWC